MEFEQQRGWQAFVSAEGQTPLWCMDFLPHIVVQRPGAEGSAIVVETDSGAVQPLEQFKAEPTILEAPIQFADTCKPVALVCYVLRRPWYGARSFWSLKVLHRQVQGATKLTPSQWYQSWWPWWVKRCTRAGLPESHMRRANRTNHSAEVPGPWNLKLRCFGDACVSSFVLALLWPKWSHSLGADKKGGDAAMAWRSSFDGLLSKFFPPDAAYEWVLFADAQAIVEPSLPLRGHAPFKVKVSGKSVFRPKAMELPVLAQRTFDAAGWQA